jgi:16S rRNA pseudouridine516 synthase
MRLEQVLFSQGFGSRRQCAALIEAGRVAVQGAVCLDPMCDLKTEGLSFEVDGHTWRYHELAYLVLNKPAGTECSQRPGAWPSIYTLLPDPLRSRPRRQATDGVQAVGRLDQDTTGMLLLTDDGALIHRLASPKHHVPKVYEVTTADEISLRMVAALCEGVCLEGESKPVKAAACRQTQSHQLVLTLTEGKYHQVKRMIAAVGGHVVGLHRSRIGRLELPSDLAPGQYRWLSAADLALACDVSAPID